MTPHERRIKKSHKKARKDINEPIKPANGYVLYLTRNRERLRLANPGKSFPEVTVLLAAEWNQLDEEGKKPWMDEAASNKAKWVKDLEEYHQSDAYKQFQKSLKADDASKKQSKNKQSKKKENKSPTKQVSVSPFKSPNKPPPAKRTKTSTSTQPRIPVVSRTGILDHKMDTSFSGNKEDIPIFTEQFLEHNKCRETELRRLRKVTTEFEEQNSVLAKHIENMKAAEIKLRAEMVLMKEKNQDVIDHLEKLKVQFVQQFSNVPIPGTNEYPTLANVESYITRLHDKILEQQKVRGNKENELIQEKLHQFVTLMAREDK